MPSRYIASGADITQVRNIIKQLPQAAGICFNEDSQSVVLIDPATGAEITLGTFSGDPGAIAVDEDELIIGQAGDVGASVPMSGDGTIDAAGVLTLSPAFQAALALIADLPTADPENAGQVWWDQSGNALMVSAGGV